MQEMQQSAKNKEFAFSRLGPQPAWLAGGCCVQPQTDLNSLRVQQSHQSSSLLNNLTSLPSPSQLSLSPPLLSYPSHSPDWFPTSPHPAVSLLRDSPSVFIDLAAAAAAVRWQQQNWAAAVHKLLLLLQRYSAPERHLQTTTEEFLLPVLRYHTYTLTHLFCTRNIWDISNIFSYSNIAWTNKNPHQKLLLKHPPLAQSKKENILVIYVGLNTILPRK